MKTERIFFTLLAFSCIAYDRCISVRILGIFPTPSLSHQVVYRALMEELAMRGHRVVMMTPDPAERNTFAYENLTEIDVHDISYPQFKETIRTATDMNTFSPMSAIAFMTSFYNTIIIIAERQLQIPEMQKLLYDPHENFDLCFFESLVPIMYGFAHRFNCSVILMSSFSGTLNNFEAFGSPTNPALYPDMMSKCSPPDCTFIERLNELIHHFQYKFTYYWNILPKYDKIAKKYFGESMKSLGEIERNADLIFLNCNPLMVGIRPVFPGVIYLGRLHLKPAKPLPHNIQSILDNATNGVIYFSFGTNMKTNYLTKHHVNIFLDVFRELPYSIIWKWDNDMLPNKPKNVFTFDWIPQRDLFNHSKVKAFITQGGLQSMDEAISQHIPMIVFPVFADQHINNKIATQHGISIGLDLKTIDKNIFKSSLIEVIENPIYKSNIIKLSNLVVDQPQTPMERAVWWTEYVIRNKGAKHLRSPSSDTPFYIYLFVDIAAVCATCILLGIVISCYFCKLLRFSFTFLDNKSKME